MFRLLVLLVSLTLGETALRCDYKGYKDEKHWSDETMEWFNTFFESWYQTNKHDILKMVTEEVNSKVKTGLPSWIVSLKLERFGFSEGSGPVVTRVRTDQDMVRCLNEANHVVKLRRVTFEHNMLLNSKKSIADVGVGLPLGVSARLSLSSVTLLAQGRLEVLMSTDAGFPGLVSAAFSFTDVPIFKFNVDIYDLIGLDTFGLDKWASKLIEDTVQDHLVYPGTLYIDLRGLSVGRGIKTDLVKGTHGEFKEWPAAYSVGFKIIPVNVTSERVFKLSVQNTGVEPEFIHRITDEGEFQFDLALSSFANKQVDIKIKEDISFAKDPTLVLKQVSLTSLLDRDTMNSTYHFAHYDGDESWKFEISVWAYLLPAALVEQKGISVAHYPTFASEAVCNKECPEVGVLYVHVHKATGLTTGDPEETIDPLVKVYLNDNQVFHTKKNNSKDPVFDARFQVQARARDGSYPELFNQTLRFDVWDYDKFTEDDFIGRASLQLSHVGVINEQLTLRVGNSTEGHGDLYVSVIFKPVPFYNYE